LRSFHEARDVEQAPFQQLLWDLPFLKTIAPFVAGHLSRASK
jgi:hypothetical protein